MSAAIAAHGSFDARTREAIALAVGNQNGCSYCQAAHASRPAGRVWTRTRSSPSGPVEWISTTNSTPSRPRPGSRRQCHFPKSSAQAAPKVRELCSRVWTSGVRSPLHKASLWSGVACTKRQGIEARLGVLTTDVRNARRG
ncbi:carboxymuconolactone decarboxylase family protein [Pseudarthrobacter sp. N5]|uniref:carboxymuconolactone decarboxylase family protein n=1 Tax=Pseudarthrobacter sp. N5 TaxID=3418416 RepID=UPI003CF49015